MKSHLKNITRNCLALGLAIGLFASCTYDQNPVPVVPEEVSFATDLVPMFEAKCNACHASVAPVLTSDVAYGNLINFNYINTTDPASSLFYTKIDGGSMDSYASNEDRSVVLKWIEQGALDN